MDDLYYKKYLKYKQKYLKLQKYYNNMTGGLPRHIDYYDKLNEFLNTLHTLLGLDTISYTYYENKDDKDDKGNIKSKIKYEKLTPKEKEDLQKLKRDPEYVVSIMTQIIDNSLFRYYELFIDNDKNEPVENDDDISKNITEKKKFFYKILTNTINFINDTQVFGISIRDTIFSHIINKLNNYKLFNSYKDINYVLDNLKITDDIKILLFCSIKNNI
jgi:hypothetical protein